MFWKAAKKTDCIMRQRQALADGVAPLEKLEHVRLTRRAIASDGSDLSEGAYGTVVCVHDGGSEYTVEVGVTSMVIEAAGIRRA